MSTNIPLNTETLIFDYLFMVKIPHLLSRSESDIRNFGVRMSGDKKVDQALAGQLLTTAISIAKMVEYHKQGIPIRVVKYTDVPTIYDYISKHLDAWKVHLENGLNTGDAPIDDLVAMDEFANLVYDKAKFQFTRETANSILLRSMTGKLSINQSNFFKQNTKANEVINGTTEPDKMKPDEDQYPERKGYSSFLTGSTLGRGKWN